MGDNQQESSNNLQESSTGVEGPQEIDFENADMKDLAKNYNLLLRKVRFLSLQYNHFYPLILPSYSLPNVAIYARYFTSYTYN